jgi:hypothetical protein
MIDIHRLYVPRWLKVTFGYFIGTAVILGMAFGIMYLWGLLDRA